MSGANRQEALIYDTKTHKSKQRGAKNRFARTILVAAAIVTAGPASAQDWFKTGTGLGVSKAKIAVPDLASRSTAAQPLEKTFHDVLWADLGYSGILDLVSPSFYPLQAPSQPSELKAADWANAPANATMIAYGNLTTDGSRPRCRRISL